MILPKFNGGKEDYIEAMVNYIAEKEGFKTNPYLDSRGKPTAGYGFTSAQHQHKWTEKEARNVLRQMVRGYDRMLTLKLGDAYTKADTNRKIGYADLMHQVGIHFDQAMPKFYAAALAGDEAAMQREINWGIGQTDNRNNARRSLFGYSPYTRRGSVRQPSDLKRVTFTNPNLPLTEPLDNTYIEKPNTDFVLPTNNNEFAAGLQNKANAYRSLLNIYDMADWHINNTNLPEVNSYGINRSNRLQLPSLRSIMEKQLNPMKLLNQNFEDYVSDIINPMKYQIKMPNIFENM